MNASSTISMLTGLLSLCLFLPAMAGDFSGSLKGVTITDSEGINKPPAAIFTYTVNGEIVTFDASGSSDADGTITKYVWDFGDGSFGGGIIVKHTYSKGNFNAKLLLFDDKDAVAISNSSINIEFGNFYWSGISSEYANYPDQCSILASGGASVGEHYGIDSGDTNGYNKYFSIINCKEMLNPAKGRIKIKFYPNANNKTIFRVKGLSNGEISIIYTSTGNVTFTYRYTPLTSLKSYTLNTWHTVYVWWDGANDFINMKVDEDEELQKTMVSGADLSGIASDIYLGGYPGTNGIGFITDVNIW